MAARYWVGGASTWDATAGTKWSLTDGGAGGEAVPTSADDVYFTAASGANTVTVAATSNCLNLNCTGFTGTLAGSSGISVYGSLTLVSGMTFSYTGTITMRATSTGQTITTAGKTISNLTLNGAGGEWTLQDALSATTLDITAGSFVTNNNNMTLAIWSTTGSPTKSCTLGSSTVTTNGGSSPIGFAGTNFTFNAGTSTINSTVNSGQTFNFGGNTFNVVNINITYTSNNLDCNISSSGTFSSLSITSSGASIYPHRVILTNGITLTATTFSITGKSFHRHIELITNSGGSTATLSSTNNGTFRFLTIRDIVASGGGYFYGDSSSQQGSTSGWDIASSTRPVNNLRPAIFTPGRAR